MKGRPSSQSLFPDNDRGSLPLVTRVLNPPLYKVIQGWKNRNELLAPSTESICKERKNCEGSVAVRSYYSAQRALTPPGIYVLDRCSDLARLEKSQQRINFSCYVDYETIQ